MTSKSKTNKAGSSKTKQTKKAFQFRWWMAASLVVIVAIAGILVLRYSQASSTGYIYTVKTTGGALGIVQLQKYNQGKMSGTINVRNRYGLWEIVPQTTSNIMCVFPISGGPIQNMGAVTQVEEKPCV